MAEKLKPCPFCGERNELYPGYATIDGKIATEPYQIDCIGCGMDFNPREGQDTIARWNHRPIEQQLIEALEECAEYFDDRADADCDDRGFIPNTEMTMGLLVQAAIAKARGEQHG